MLDALSAQLPSEVWPTATLVLTPEEYFERVRRVCLISPDALELIQHLLKLPSREVRPRRVSFDRVAGRHLVSHEGMWSYKSLEEGAAKEKGLGPLSLSEVFVARLLHYERSTEERTRVFCEDPLRRERCFEFSVNRSGRKYISAFSSSPNPRFRTDEHWIGKLK